MFPHVMTVLMCLKDIHYLYLLSQGHGGLLEPIPALFGRKEGVHPGRVAGPHIDEQPCTPTGNLEPQINLTCMSCGRKPMQARANSTQKGPCLGLNQEPSCCEATVLTTKPPCCTSSQ